MGVSKIIDDMKDIYVFKVRNQHFLCETRCSILEIIHIYSLDIVCIYTISSDNGRKLHGDLTGASELTNTIITYSHLDATEPFPAANRETKNKT